MRLYISEELITANRHSAAIKGDYSMNITPLTSAAGKGSSAQGTDKISIPNSTRMINAASIKWLNKVRSAISDHIRTSIEKGKLFELASLGSNMFGVPALSARSSTLQPVLAFEADPNHDLNLVRVYMQDSAGKLNPWEPTPHAVTTTSTPSEPDAQSDTASSSLPRRPPAGSVLSLLGIALDHAQRHSTRADRSAKGRPGREERNGARFAKQTKPTEAEAHGDHQAPYPDLTRPKEAAQRVAESITNMREQQNGMQRAEALLRAKEALQAREAARKQLLDVLEAIQSGREDSTDKKISATEKNATGINYQ
ncbi:type III effector [Pseudomonas syringae pv. actinidiae]|nr:type III effector [Pseudomonas syringae]EPN23483.1 type III effector HopY1 [Pseudomonas syringae pv. actinidiae ICMP 19070]EPN57096.1 type III effector HopY1 [Pseudomonas syringae pv. actinidiae ICMP 19079]EPN85773.1 type III effector HopY1 [Pseudomonas syringae pv. actinidiae ICMP 19101]AOE54640.1 type III effector [Pseudomonas syringae pv. actinidiae ICMP 18708]APP95504.1 type III effector [Pseudomonas syringae pv. actinidiae]